MEHTCESCGRTFDAKTSRARFCSTTCRSRAARARKAAERSAEVEAAGAAEAESRRGQAEHELVVAVRAELEEAGALNSFSGQLALQLARRVANPEESGVTTLSKELRTVMAAALEHRQPPAPDPDGGDEPTVPDDDELTAAREARERKAREAAAARA